MRKRYSGNRRTALPSDRHKRAVSFRHCIYAGKKQNVYHSVIQKKDSLFITADETVEKHTETTEISIPHLEETKPEEKKAKKKKKKQSLSRSEKREIKYQEKEDELDRLASEPDFTAGECILHPFAVIKKASEYDYAMLSNGQIFASAVCRWLLIGFALAEAVCSHINTADFSILSMNFTQEAYLALRLFIYGIISEYVNYRIIGAYASTLREGSDRARIHALGTFASPLEFCFFILACLFMHLSSVAGLILLAAGIVAGLACRIYALVLCHIHIAKIVLAIGTCLVLFFLLGFVYVHLFCGDIFQIFALMN